MKRGLLGRDGVGESTSLNPKTRLRNAGIRATMKDGGKVPPTWPVPGSWQGRVAFAAIAVGVVTAVVFAFPVAVATLLALGSRSARRARASLPGELLSRHRLST